MDRALFAASDTGRVVRTRTGYDAFVPADLPPHIDWDTRVVRAVEAAARAIGEASAILSGDTSGRYLDLLLSKEAVGAATVEGQPATLEETFTAIATGMPVSGGVQLAHNYINAFRHVQGRLDEISLSLRLIREGHYLLSQQLEHSGSYPGEFRRSQNWLGPEGCSLSGATLVPPPVEEMKAALDNWERYLHSTDTLPSVVKVAILHYQFAVVRPFLECN
ncbi:Fic family protein, partial [Chloroflexota bacterium]